MSNLPFFSFAYITMCHFQRDQFVSADINNPPNHQKIQRTVDYKEILATIRIKLQRSLPSKSWVKIPQPRRWDQYPESAPWPQPPPSASPSPHHPCNSSYPTWAHPTPMSALTLPPSYRSTYLDIKTNILKLPLTLYRTMAHPGLLPISIPLFFRRSQTVHTHR